MKYYWLLMGDNNSQEIGISDSGVPAIDIHVHAIPQALPRLGNTFCRLVDTTFAVAKLLLCGNATRLFPTVLE